MNASDHTSIILVHYSKCDDFGEKAAGRNPPSRSLLAKECVQAIVDNTDSPAELIVMDNGGDPDDSDFFLDLARQGKLTHVRFPKNMHFAFAWNYGARLATGNTLSFICNDVVVEKGWLNACLEILKKYEGMRIVATPFITYDKRKMTTIKDGFRWNPRSGSNCMVITRAFYEFMGDFPHHRIGGTVWYNKLKSLGIPTIAPPNDMAKDKGWRHGVNFSIPIKITKTLLDNSEVDFTSTIKQ